MKTLRQLLRQPIKTISGLLLMTIAASILCVCVGQAIAAKTTAENLNNQFSTIALPTPFHSWGDEEGITSAEMPSNLLSWLQEAAQSHPEIVKGIAQQGFLSAYIPELTPMNFTTGSYIADCWLDGNWQYYNHQAHPTGRPYSCAMLVITLDEVSEPTQQNYKFPIEANYKVDDFDTTKEYLDWLKSPQRNGGWLLFHEAERYCHRGDCAAGGLSGSNRHDRPVKHFCLYSGRIGGA